MALNVALSRNQEHAVVAVVWLVVVLKCRYSLHVGDGDCDVRGFEVVVEVVSISALKILASEN